MFPQWSLEQLFLSPLSIQDIWDHKFLFLQPRSGVLHGRIVHITPQNGVVKTEIYGPRYLGWKGVKETTVPMTIEGTSEGLKVTLPDTTLQLYKGIWSPHIIIRFSTG